MVDTLSSGNKLSHLLAWAQIAITRAAAARALLTIYCERRAFTGRAAFFSLSLSLSLALSLSHPLSLDLFPDQNTCARRCFSRAPLGLLYRYRSPGESSSTVGCAARPGSSSMWLISPTR